jgi:hypothetical protein
VTLACSALLFSACGGSADPCDGVSGTCLSVRVTSSSVKQLDALVLDASGAVSGTKTSTESGSKTLSLPVGIAISFSDSSVSGQVHLVATAKRGGTVEGTGATDATIIPGKHVSATINLAATSQPGSDAGTDGGPVGDGGPDSGIDAGPPPCTGGCLLAALEGSVAAVGDVLNLEGNFNTPMTVNFGGGVQASATLLGSNRATVVVPTGAITGSVSVTISGQTFGGLPLRVASFTSGLGNFEPTFDQVEGARLTPNLVYQRQGTAAVVIGSYVYVIAGTGFSSSLTSVERAPINADGSLGSFALLGGAQLGTGRYNHAAVVIGGYLYVVGGQGADGKAVTSVERISVASDGTFETFEAGGTLGTARTQFALAVIGNRLYAIGGTDAGGNALNTVESAVIGSDGTLGAFAPVTATLVTARSGHSAQVIGNTLYVLAGSSANVEQATISADGSIGTFSKSSGPLAASVSQSSSIVIGGNIYLVGGIDTVSGKPSTIVQGASAAGAVGGFSDLSGTVHLSSPRAGHATVLIGNYLYAIGGLSLNGTLQAASSTIERAPINASGNLAAFKQQPAEALKTSRFGHTATVLGNYLYIVGGYSSGVLGSIEQASIQPDGTLGSFTTSSTALVTPREYHTTAVIGSYLYVIGGDAGAGAQILPIERASINADGTLSAFSNYSLTTKTAHTGHTSAVIGLTLYVFDQTQSEAATITNSAGDLSAFTVLTGVTTGPPMRSGAVLQNLIYSIGGEDFTVSDFVLQTATITNGSVAQFKTATGLSGPPPYGFVTDILGSRLVTFGGQNSGNTFFPDVYAAAIQRDGTLMNFTALTSSPLANSRAWGSVTAVGNYVWIIGGMTPGAGGQDVPIGITEQSQLR